MSKLPYCPWALERFKIEIYCADDAFTQLQEDITSQTAHVAGLRGFMACLVAICLWTFYVTQHRDGIAQMCLRHNEPRVIALNGETTKRTRHVLRAISSNDVPVAGVIFLGRVRHRPR